MFRIVCFDSTEFVNPFDDSVFASRWHFWHHVVFVANHDVVDGRFAFLVHLFQAVENDRCSFVVESRVVSSHGGESHRV